MHSFVTIRRDQDINPPKTIQGLKNAKAYRLLTVLVTETFGSLLESVKQKTRKYFHETSRRKKYRRIIKMQEACR